MSKVEVQNLIEKNIVEINVSIDGKPGRVLFESASKDKKDALISFDMGATWIPLIVAHAAIMKFVDQFPFAIPQE